LSRVDGQSGGRAELAQPALASAGADDGRPGRDDHPRGESGVPLPEAVVTALPWDALADAFEELEEARRHGTPDQLERAQLRWAETRDRMGLVGATILHAAVSGFGSNANGFFGGGVFLGTPQAGYVLRSTLDRLAELMGFATVREIALGLERQLKAAIRLARQAHEEIDALKQRIVELECRVENRTPGVGEPGT
jgi:hypothetical protein